LAWGTFSLLEELLLIIVLSFSFREAPRIPKDVIRFPWEYFVPERGGYDWRLTERHENDGNGFCSAPAANRLQEKS
jgi:hypothetical protein